MLHLFHHCPAFRSRPAWSDRLSMPSMCDRDVYCFSCLIYFLIYFMLARKQKIDVESPKGFQQTIDQCIEFLRSVGYQCSKTNSDLSAVAVAEAIVAAVEAEPDPILGKLELPVEEFDPVIDNWYAFFFFLHFYEYFTILHNSSRFLHDFFTTFHDTSR
jgi:hypothetical protein